MPLLKRSAFALAEVPSDLKPNEYVYQVRYTKEIFRDYQEYLKRINLYRQKVWACKVTGKANLTYEQALLSESRASEQVQNFPKEFVGPVLRMVQFSPLCVSDLVDKLYKKFKDHFVEGEAVDCMCEDGTVAPCRIVRVVEETVCEKEACSCVYEVAWTKEEGTSRELGQNLRRKKHPLTKALLKSFIRESAFIGVSKNSRWAVHDKLARQYNIPLSPSEEAEELDEENSDNLLESENGDPASSEAMQEDDIESSGAAKKKKAANGGKRMAANGGSRRLKYPVDDNMLPPCEDRPKPNPCSHLGMPMQRIGDLLMVWDFCISFGKALELSPFSLEDFDKALCYKSGECTLLGELHHALLEATMSDASVYELFNQKRKRKRELSAETWRSDLSDLLQLKASQPRASEKLKTHAANLRQCDYEELEPEARLDILHELTDWSVGSAIIKSQLDEHIPKRKDSGKKKASAEDEDEPVSSKKSKAAVEEEDERMPGNKRKKVAVDDEDEPPGPSENGNGVSFKGSQMLKMFKRKKPVEKGRKQKQEEAEPKCPLRSIYLGLDRLLSRYWFFSNDGRVFVESQDSKLWSFYDSMEEFHAFYNSLNVKGVREKALKEQIDLHYDSICNGFERRVEEMEEAPRRTGRGKSSSRQAGFLAYVNEYRTG